MTKNSNTSSHRSLIEVLFRITDSLIVFISGFLIYYYQQAVIFPERYQLLLIVLIIITLNVFSWFSIYKKGLNQPLYKELYNLTIAWLIVVLSVSTLLFLTKTGESYSRLWAVWTFTTTYILFVLYRAVIFYLLRYTSLLNVNQKQVVIIGAGSLGKRACKAIAQNSWLRLKTVAVFDDNKELVGQNCEGTKIIGTIDDVVQFIESHRNSDDKKNIPIDQVWIALPLTEAKRIEELQDALLDTATNVYFIPDLFSFNLSSYSVGEVAGIPVMNMSANNLSTGSWLVKRLEDLVIATILIIVLSPLFLIVAILIKHDSAGPVFFKQRRYGQDGKEIWVWKFRSMTVTEDGDKIEQAKRNDDRITKTGKWLRKLSIDELPQLINVIKGNMSLVGPRPHAIAHNEFYRSKVRGYMARHKTKPGITGWAQVNGYRGETVNIEDMEHRIRYDLEYITDWSIFLDIKILFMTIKTIIDIKNTY